MKRICLCLILALFIITSLGHAGENIVFVNVPSLNIRAEPGTEYPVVKSVPIGYPLKILAETEKWYKVELKDKSVGWTYKTMLTDDTPAPIKLGQLETKYNTQSIEFEQTKEELQAQTKLNTRLNSQLKETRQELDKFMRKNRDLERQDHIKLAGIGIVILLLGWGAGFLTGFFKRQAEDKRFVKMMVDANSLRKGGR